MKQPLFKICLLFLYFFCFYICIAQRTQKPVFESEAYSLFADSVIQKEFSAIAISSTEMVSNYKNTGVKKETDNTSVHWKLAKDISAFPQYHSDYPLIDAIYNLSLEEMINAVEPDSTFRTGKLWSGVWTRDISYSIILSMSYMQPRVAMNSLLRKVTKDGKIIQDTGTGGAYPCSTDRMIWAVAAWNVYIVTGDQAWLKRSYDIIKNSAADDMLNAYDKTTGLVFGESSFLDWREQTYPLWMQPVDIYASECLGTNAVHYQANIVMSWMALQLRDQKAFSHYSNIALQIKKGINKYLWMKDKGYYGQYLYGRNYKIISPRAEALGEALCVLFGIADESQIQSIIENTPVTPFGISCIFPQIPGIPPYHNNAVWPFVAAFWAKASAKAGNGNSVAHAIGSIDRAAALFLTNKENFVADNGDYAGTQINSSNMLWSLSGNISMIHSILFGISFLPDKLVFQPFIPESLKGVRKLTNFKYRDAVLDIEISGFGNQINTFLLDGKILPIQEIPSGIKGQHTIKIRMANNQLPEKKTNRVQNYTTVQTPLPFYENNRLGRQTIDGAVNYLIIQNGKKIAETETGEWIISGSAYNEYQLIAVDKNGVASFASEPMVIAPENLTELYQAETFAPKSVYDYKGFTGDGFVEVSTSINGKLQIPINVNQSGLYAIDVRYANGNGPINTENKCAIRTIRIDGIQIGTLVLPQRGVKEWNDWGFSNSIQVMLTPGKHAITIAYEPANENMNGLINQAMIDYIRVIKMK